MSTRRSGAADRLAGAVRDSLEGSYLLAPLATVEYTNDKNNTERVVVRMPNQIALFDDLWAVIEEQAKLKKLKVKRASKYPTVKELAEIMGNVKWLWKQWIPVGFLTLLVAEPGIGKSFIALDWIRHVLTQECWPLTNDRPGKQNACAVWIETESSQQLLAERSLYLKVPQDRIIVPGFGDDLLGQPDLGQEADRNKIRDVIENVKPSIVVLDSLGGAHSGGENRIEEVRPMLAFLSELSRDEIVPTVAVHHLRKRRPNESIEITMDNVRGSSGFSAFARSIVSVSGSSQRKTLKVIKSNLAVMPPPINFKMMGEKIGEDEFITSIEYSPWEAPKRKKNKKELCARWVQQTLSEVEEIPFTDLLSKAEPRGYSRSTLYAVRNMLEEFIEIDGDGRHATWRLNSKTDLSDLDGLFDSEEEQDKGE